MDTFVIILFLIVMTCSVIDLATRKRDSREVRQFSQLVEFFLRITGRHP